MIAFDPICRYKNNYDLVWDGKITFPSGLSGATFVDGWAQVPSTRFSGLQYNVRQIYTTRGRDAKDPFQYITDWEESGTAVDAGGFFIAPQSAECRAEIVKRFLSSVSTTGLNQQVGLWQLPNLVLIANTTFCLRIGIDAYAVSDIAIDDTCTDNPITVTWSVSAQTVCEVQVKNSAGSVVYAARTDTATPSVTIPAGALPDGAVVFCVQAGYDLSSALHSAGAGVQTTVATLDATLWRIVPQIVAFEPDAVAQNREQSIPVTWFANNQHACRLRVLQNGIAIKTFSGTTQTAYTIPANTLKSAEAALELQISYQPTWGGARLYANKTITFDAYGTPPTPALTTAATVSTAFPLITWTASEQFCFRLQILRGADIVQDTQEVASELPRHQITTPLQNGTYTLRLTVQNEYGLSSATATRGLRVSYVLPQKPAIYCAAVAKTGAVNVRVMNAEQVIFDCCDLFRRAAGGEWVRILQRQAAAFTYEDFAVASGVTYEYRARALSTQAGAQDSDIAVATPQLYVTELFAADRPHERICLRLLPQRTETPRRSVHLMEYAGTAAPCAEYGDRCYCEIQASFYVTSEDAARIKALYFGTSLLVYRDSRGRLLYGCISADPQVSDDAYGWCAVSFTFTQTRHEVSV